MDIPIKQVRDMIWSRCLKLSVEMQYSRKQHYRSQYDALQELWTTLGDIEEKGSKDAGVVLLRERDFIQEER